ncbi:MAG TPA: hypothetical protein VLE03_05140 [Nitrospiraceae bacterium]|nr:hypothetical protein [Nitrospiraceae bacterium]
MMTARAQTCGLFPVFVAVTLSGFWGSEWPAFAASPKSKNETKPAVTQPSGPAQEVVSKAPPPRGKKSPNNEAEERVAQAAQGKKPSDSTTRKIRRHSRTNKKLNPAATVQPGPDFSYHGLLKRPQRYDPTRDRRKGGVPNPQAGDLLHEHFQELDRNYDGTIDPVERAVGRLDIDRDLSNRQWE